MKVSKTFKWEGAHRLVHGYPGNCSQLHGHSYTATVVMESLGALNNFGFVKDFNEMKVLKTWVDGHWDHATLVSSDDSELLSWLLDHKQRHFIIEHNPTAEIIGATLFAKASTLLDDEFSRVSEVRINETCTSETVVTSPYLSVGSAPFQSPDQKHLITQNG